MVWIFHILTKTTSSCTVLVLCLKTCMYILIFKFYHVNTSINEWFYDNGILTTIERNESNKLKVLQDYKMGEILMWIKVNQSKISTIGSLVLQKHLIHTTRSTREVRYDNIYHFDLFIQKPCARILKDTKIGEMCRNHYNIYINATLCAWIDFSF
jgi:hypothetical protein